MADFIATTLGYPVVVWTILLGVTLLYWLLVVLGALDIDLFASGGGLDGAVDGALDGAAGGALEAADGSLDGATDALAHGQADGLSVDGHGHGHGLEPTVLGHGSPAQLGALSLGWIRVVPITVSVSVFVVFGWLWSFAGVRLARGVVDSPGLLMGTAILGASVVLALPLTVVCVRPLKGLFTSVSAKGHRELVGKVGVVTTGSVDARFGQATLETGDLSLLVQVRYEEAGKLRRGDRVLLLNWDAQREAFLVEPMQQLLPEQGVREG